MITEEEKTILQTQTFENILKILELSKLVEEKEEDKKDNEDGA